MNKQDLDRHITGNYGEDSVGRNEHDYVRLVAQARKSQNRAKALRALHKAYARLAGDLFFVRALRDDLIEENEDLREQIADLRATLVIIARSAPR